MENMFVRNGRETAVYKEKVLLKFPVKSDSSLQHFLWRQDSAGVPFAHEKNNQAGDTRKMKPRNLYPNPFDPRIATILATFEYMVVFPTVLADPDGPLYPGSEESQSK